MKKLSPWAYATVILSILLMSLTIQTAFGQNGKLKLKGDIVNVSDESTQSLITLFRVPEHGGGTFVLGQFIVEGNDWFKTHLDLEKTYMLEISSTNGVAKRFFFDTNVPQDLEDARLKMDLSFDMSSSDEEWVMIEAGEVSFEDRETEFAFIDWIEDNSVAMNPNR